MKCVRHYLHEIFNLNEDPMVARPSSVQNIWDFISDHARKKYNITIGKDILAKIHLTGLFTNIIQKLNIKLNVELGDIDFNKVDIETGKACFLDEDSIK